MDPFELGTWDEVNAFPDDDFWAGWGGPVVAWFPDEKHFVTVNDVNWPYGDDEKHFAVRLFRVNGPRSYELVADTKVDMPPVEYSIFVYGYGLPTADPNTVCVFGDENGVEGYPIVTLYIHRDGDTVTVSLHTSVNHSTPNPSAVSSYLQRYPLPYQLTSMGGNLLFGSAAVEQRSVGYGTLAFTLELDPATNVTTLLSAVVLKEGPTTNRTERTDNIMGSRTIYYEAGFGYVFGLNYQRDWDEPDYWVDAFEVAIAPDGTITDHREQRTVISYGDYGAEGWISYESKMSPMWRHSGGKLVAYLACDIQDADTGSWIDYAYGTFALDTATLQATELEFLQFPDEEAVTDYYDSGVYWSTWAFQVAGNAALIVHNNAWYTGSRWTFRKIEYDADLNSTDVFWVNEYLPDPDLDPTIDSSYGERASLSPKGNGFVMFDHDAWYQWPFSYLEGSVIPPLRLNQRDDGVPPSGSSGDGVRIFGSTSQQHGGVRAGSPNVYR